MEAVCLPLRIGSSISGIGIVRVPAFVFGDLILDLFESKNTALLTVKHLLICVNVAPCQRQQLSYTSHLYGTMFP